MNYFNFSCNALYYIIIQLTPHWGFSVTDYIKYYDYLICYLLSLDYLSLQQSRYYFPNCVYPNPPCQLSRGRELEHPEKTHDFRQSVDRLFSHESVARIEPTFSEVKGACSDDCATEAPERCSPSLAVARR
jgi:hypothetical protein